MNADELNKIKWGNAWACPEPKCGLIMVVPKYMDKNDQDNTEVKTLMHGCSSFSPAPTEFDYYIDYLKLFVKVKSA